jgi:hypothetical protein
VQRLARFILLLFASWHACPLPARAEALCHPSALGHLETLAPAGFAIYARASSKKDFLHWVTCDDIVLGLTTAVHETVHMISAETGAYPLIGGGSVSAVEETAAYFPPRLIAGKFDRDSQFVTTYLTPGHASSADLLRYLLDELNAYTHDLSSAVLLHPIARRDRDVYHRDGLAALMAFVAAYAEEARLAHPRTWRELQKPAAKLTVATLWGEAERVMASSCALPGFGMEAPRTLALVCKATIKHGLGQILGRPPLCPRRCLAEPATERAAN